MARATRNRVEQSDTITDADLGLADVDGGGGGSGDGSGGNSDGGGGSGAGGGNSADSSVSLDPGSAFTDAGTGDDFVRDADGNIKRNKDGSPRKRRGRKSGSARTEKTPSISVSGIETILLSIHGMGAAVLRSPEFALEKDESRPLAEAIANVARHYPTTIDPKVLDWLNLCMVCGGIYGAKIYLIRERLKKERASAITHNPLPDISNVGGFGHTGLS